METYTNNTYQTYYYKNFQLNFTITFQNQRYIAEGFVACPNSPQLENPTQNFHTEFDTSAGAINELKKIFKNYVDFEMKHGFSVPPSPLVTD